MEAINVMVFWISTAFIAYTYFVYPYLVYILSLLKNHKIDKRFVTLNVDYIVIVYNEQSTIRKKIENCLSLNYPSDSIVFHFVSSGSTDDTDSIIQEYLKKNVTFTKIDKNYGKSYALNRIIKSTHNEIIVFSDVRQTFNPDAVTELVSNFNDVSVGAVSGELVFEEAQTINIEKSIGIYWNYEKIIRRSESAFHSTVGTTGCIYAIRRNLFQAISDDTILDDFVIPMNIVLQGFRVVFDGKAKATDIPTKNLYQEFERKARTLGGNFQAFSRMPILFDPHRNPVFFQFLSHKVFRLCIPVFLLLALVSSALIENSIYRIIYYLQIGFYLACILGLLYKGNYAIRAGGAFLMLNISIIVGAYRFLVGNLNPNWKKS